MTSGTTDVGKTNAETAEESKASEYSMSPAFWMFAESDSAVFATAGAFWLFTRSVKVAEPPPETE